MIKKTIALIVIALSFVTATFAADGNTDSGRDNTKFRIQYMGNVEAGHIFPWEDFMRNTTGIVTLTTTHGVRLTPYLFTGIGIGAWLGYYSGGCSMLIPYYADVRLTLPNQRLRPFFDMKVGRAGSNTIIGPSIGCKYAWGNKGGVYLSVGTNYITNEYRSGWDGLNLRLGFDF